MVKNSIVHEMAPAQFISNCAGSAQRRIGSALCESSINVNLGRWWLPEGIEPDEGADDVLSMARRTCRKRHCWYPSHGPSRATA
jgi:hypothetical protein